MEHPQLLWAACARASLYSHSKQFFPDIWFNPNFFQFDVHIEQSDTALSSLALNINKVKLNRKEVTNKTV